MLHKLNELGIPGAVISFNADECVVLKLYFLQAKGSNVQFQLNGEPLMSVGHQLDLCVIMNETLKPHRQCANDAKTANPIMRAIKASFIDITPAPLHALYGTHIHPLLKYIHSKPGARAHTPDLFHELENTSLSTSSALERAVTVSYVCIQLQGTNSAGAQAIKLKDSTP